MANDNIQFEAGNEFAAAPVASAPPAPEPQASEPTSSPAESQPVQVPQSQASWADKVEGDEDPKPADAQPAAPEGSKITVKSKGEVKEFALDPENEDLKKTLSWGVRAPEFKRKMDQALEENQTLKRESKDYKEKAQVWDEIQELAQLGQHERIVRAVLGEDGFDALKAEWAEEQRLMVENDPAALAAFQSARRDRDDKFKDFQSKRKQDTLQSKLDAYEERVETERIRGLATTALAKYDFRDIIEDADVAHVYNSRVAKLAMSSLRDYASANNLEAEDITPELINKAVAREAKALRAGIKRMSDKKVDTIIENKKQTAAREAQIMATERYPGTAPGRGVDLSSWDGKSASELTRLLRGY